MPSFPQIIGFVLNPPFVGIFLYIKTAFIVASLVLLTVIIIIFSRGSWLTLAYGARLSEFFGYKPTESRQFSKQWQRVAKRLRTGTESESKLALMEADRLLDETLDKAGLKGESVADRLKRTPPGAFPNIDEMLEAHKVSSDIIHDPDYKLSAEEAKNVMNKFEKIFQDLEALE